MITRDLWQIMAPETGKFLHLDFRSPGFAAGEKPRPGAWLALFEEDPIAASMYTRSGAEATLANDAYPLQRDRLRLVPAPQCGCCGLTDCSWSNPRELRLVADGPVPEQRVWRCEKHIGRAPCCIEGCGRTFAFKSGADYSVTYICGKHWREAPRYMRDRVKRLRAIGVKRHWPARLDLLYGKAFDRAVQAVREGRHIDMSEISKMFGLDG